MRVDFFHSEYRAKRSGFPDLLRFDAVIGPGVVLGKGGELISTYRYRGPDMQCASEGELSFLRSRVNDMLKVMGGGWMIHSTTVRRESLTYSTQGAFPDPVTAAIEDERRAQHQREGLHYENDYYITFTYLPDPLLLSRVRALAIDSQGKKKNARQFIVQKNLEFFERKLTEFVGTFQSGLGSELTRLAIREEIDPGSHQRVFFDDQLSFLYYCITGDHRPIRLPRAAATFGVDFLLGSHVFTPGIRPVLNRKFIRVIAIDGLPEAGTQFGVLEMLNRLSVQFRWTTRWIARDPEAAKADALRTRAKWRQKIRGFIADATGRVGGPVNTDAAAMAADAEAVKNDWESGTVVYGYWNSTVVLTHEDEDFLDASVHYLLKSIGDHGFPARDEEVNCNEAFLGSLPGHGYENVRKPEIHSMNLADCLPLTSTWQGPASNPCSYYKEMYRDGTAPPLLQGAASGGTPFRVVLHNGDLAHTLVIGPPGAGKSTILGLFAASHFRYPSAKCVVFEKGESQLALCLGTGGTHFNFMGGDGHAVRIALAPLAHLERVADKTWAKEYVAQLLLLNDHKVTPDDRAEISRAVDLLATRAPHMRSITDLKQLVQSRPIRQILEEYETNLAGGMLNGRTDSLALGRFTVFEMEALMETGKRNVVPVLLYLFRAIERMLDGSPIQIILDEGWKFLMEEHFEEMLRDWLLTLRKSNGYVIFATQELQHLEGSAVGATLLSTCQTKILLPNPEADSSENRLLYKSLGLSDRELWMLTRAVPKRDYFFKSPAGRRLFQLELGPFALAFMGATGKEDRRRVKELYRAHGAAWTTHWLREKGVSASPSGDMADQMWARSVRGNDPGPAGQARTKAGA